MYLPAPLRRLLLAPLTNPLIPVAVIGTCKLLWLILLVRDVRRKKRQLTEANEMVEHQLRIAQALEGLSPEESARMRERLLRLQRVLEGEQPAAG